MSTKSEEVIELSVEETNRLRSELGLPPLRVSNESNARDGDESDHRSSAITDLSIHETNALRAQLGLAPLRTAKNFVHKPAENTDDEKAAKERIAQSKLRRDVEKGLSLFSHEPLGATLLNATSWAAQMRAKQEISSEQKKKPNLSISQSYDPDQLKGLNVTHSLSEIREGSQTVLTLADTSLLTIQDDLSKKVIGLNEDHDELENIDIADAKKQADRLKEKRKLELGMGRAGGYAGFDDDEFEDLGGSQGPSRMLGASKGNKALKNSIGFHIGMHFDEQDEQIQSDLFSRTVSLEAKVADVTASDFMTAEEEETEKKQRKQKGVSFKQKSKKKRNKDKRKATDREISIDDTITPGTSELIASTEWGEGKKSIADELEDTIRTELAMNRTLRRRNREDSGDESDVHTEKKVVHSKRARYDEIMEQGNKRTGEVFNSKAVRASQAIDDEEPDDAFLEAALAKARRLNRLKELTAPHQRGAEIIAETVRSNQYTTDIINSGINFTIDETREFTRALLARAEQEKRSSVKKSDHKGGVKQQSVTEESISHASAMDETPDEDIVELSKKIKEEPSQPSASTLEGSTASETSMGRGLAGVLGLLNQTGELSLKKANREELRGRAKDKKNYEDYEPLNLSEVVKIDSKSATEKDKELSRREIKLEYRDKHGRLLTRKEAFRDLSYQFHGYGSGKRKEEKRLHQVAREQAEAALASRQAAEDSGIGTLGALKATQKATGKAFVVHKTQS